MSEVPIVRHALLLIVPKAARDKSVNITVTERKETLMLDLSGPGMTVDVEIVLSPVEAQTLADHLRKMALRVNQRPEGIP